MRFNEAKLYFEENLELKDCANKGFEQIIKNKINKLTLEEVRKDFAILKNEGLIVLNKEAGYFYFNMKSPLACAYLLSYALELFKQDLPKNPLDGVIFVQDFFKEIRKPKVTNYWHVEFEADFLKYVLLEYKEFFTKNPEYIIELYEGKHGDKQSVFRLQRILPRVLTFFDFSAEEIVGLTSKLPQKGSFRYISDEIIDEYVSFSNERITAIYNLVKLNKYPHLPFPLIIEKLSHFDFEQSFEEVKGLVLKPNTEVQGIFCLGRLKFTNENEISEAFKLIEKCNIHNEDIQKVLIPVYRNFLLNKHSSSEVKEVCIDKYKNLISSKNDDIANEAIRSLSYVKGFEDKKLEYLSEIFEERKNIDFLLYFSEFSHPSYLFKFVKKLYLILGLQASIKPFSGAFGYFINRTPKEFEEEFLELLSDKVGIIRKAGVDLLTSLNVNSCDLLVLDQLSQCIILETLLEIPFNIEKVLPFVLQLKDSSFDVIRKDLEQYCIKLLYDFEDHMITILERHLDKKKFNDKKLLEEVQKKWEVYSAVIKEKKKLLELNPSINQRRYVEMYYRHESEYQYEQLEEVYKGSLMASMMHELRVLRGCGFKMEGRNQISRLGRVEAKVYINKRHFLNPESYESMRKTQIFKNYN